MRTGKAYGFLNYDQSDETLVRVMERMYTEANFHYDFPDFTFRVLTEDEKRVLKPELIRAAKKKRVFGMATFDSGLDKLIGIKPVSANRLSHVVEARVPRKTNLGVAKMVEEIFGGICDELDDVFRETILYQKSKGVYESLP